MDGSGNRAVEPKAALELYLVRLSPPCRAVWLYMLQHDIPHVLIDCDFKNDTSLPDAMSKCPHKQVPLLVDGDIVVFDGPAILRYLSTNYTNGAGFGSTQTTRMLCESVVSWANSELHRVVGFCYAYPQLVDTYRLSDDGANEVLVQSGVKQLSKHLENLENSYLLKMRYLTGDRLTVADSFVATVLIQAEWTGFKFKMWPRVEAWLRRVRAQEYWAEVHVSHSKLVTEVESAPYFD